MNDKLMDWPVILAFTVMAIGVEISPGPNFLLIARTVPSFGRRAAMGNIAGFAAGFLMHGTLSIFGFSVILAQSESLFLTVKILGAAYLCYLGVQALMEARLLRLRSVAASTPTDIDPGELKPPALVRDHLSRRFSEGFLTNCLNPKISIFYLAAFPQFIEVGQDTTLDSFILVIIHIIVNAGWFTLVALFIARLICRRPGDHFIGALKTLSGVALIVLGATFAATAATVVK